MIINHLRKFVEDNLRVVIPDVGAFLRKSKADVPFEASVIFSPFLRSNDGVLEGLVAEEEHIDRESAAEKVRKFVQNMQKAVAEKRPFHIKRLGFFYQDERGALQFTFVESKDDEGSDVAAESSGEKKDETPAAAKKTAEAALVASAAEKPEKPEKPTESEKPEEKAATPPPASAASKPDGKAQESDRKASGENDTHGHEVEANAEDENLYDVAAENAQQLTAASLSLQRWMEQRKSYKAKQTEEIEVDEVANEVEDEVVNEVADEIVDEVVDEVADEVVDDVVDDDVVDEVADEIVDEVANEVADEVVDEVADEVVGKVADDSSSDNEVESEENREADKVFATPENPPEKESEHRQETAAAVEDEETFEETFEEPENRAPFTSGVWAEEVMGRRNRSHLGAKIFLAIMLVMFVGGTFSLLYWSDISDFFRGKSGIDVETALPAPALPAPAPAAAEERQSVKPETQPEGYYYIVIGAFNSVEYAHAASKRLYNAQRVKSEVVQTSDGKFAVSLGKYSSRNAALRNIARHRRQHAHVWIAY